MSNTQEYRWYLVGCDRLDRTPLSETDFQKLWQEYQDHAELLKSADDTGKLADLDYDLRVRMERKIQNDPMLKAVLVGQSEDISTH